MIDMPKRSVTRFFIPLVDVMMLLFCIFLLMPMVKPGNDEKGEPILTKDEQLAKLKAQVDRLGSLDENRLAELKADIDRLKLEKARAIKDRLAVRVLEIDGATGKLYYNDPDRVELPDEAAAHGLIQRDLRERGVTARSCST